MLHTAPEEDLEVTVHHYWSLGYTDEKIAQHSMDHYDRESYRLREPCNFAT
jgi:hypothetical protein